MVESINDRLAKLVAANEEARRLLHDMHGATKDLRTAMKEAKELVPELVGKRIDKAVQDGLDNYSESLSKAIDSATEAVQRRFDTLADILLGEDGPSRKQGKPSIPDLAREAVRRADSGRNSG